jgi:hypothetical protein
MLAILIVTAATPTLAQTATQAAAPIGSGNQNAASIPDFSGIWARVSFPGFGRPLAGAGRMRQKL